MWARPRDEVPIPACVIIVLRFVSFRLNITVNIKLKGSHILLYNNLIANSVIFEVGRCLKVEKKR